VTAEFLFVAADVIKRLAAFDPLSERLLVGEALAGRRQNVFGAREELPEIRSMISGIADRTSGPHLRVVNADAFVWLSETDELFDFVVADFPDPSTYGVAKLYTTAFYRLVQQHLTRDGKLVVQGTSPLFASQAYWCIVETLRAAGLRTRPYHVYVPSFGEWGFVLAGRNEVSPEHGQLPDSLRFLTPEVVPSLFEFPGDMKAVEVEPNRLDEQLLVRYYEEACERTQH
jgi:spermidine synthase